LVTKGAHPRSISELPNVSSVPETVWAYLAGLIDGEGHIGIHHYKSGINTGKRMYSVHIANMNKEMLIKVNKDTQGLGSIYTRYSKARKGEGYCVSYQLTYWAGPIFILLPKVIPYLTFKKRSAEIILAVVKLAISWKPQRTVVQLQIEELEKQLNYEFNNVLHKQRKDHAMTLEEAKLKEKERYGSNKPLLAKRSQLFNQLV
jgi:hypothetical protein